jgi:hypothetical protein
LVNPFKINSSTTLVVFDDHGNRLDICVPDTYRAALIDLNDRLGSDSLLENASGESVSSQKLGEFILDEAERMRDAAMAEPAVDLATHKRHHAVFMDVAALGAGYAESLIEFKKTPKHWTIRSQGDAAYEPSYPRMWELLRFILGKDLREQVFEPAYNDLLLDHLMTRAARFQTPWARRWITLCFGLRTTCLLIQCAVVGLRGGVGTLILPAAVVFRDKLMWIWNWTIERLR